MDHYIVKRYLSKSLSTSFKTVISICDQVLNMDNNDETATKEIILKEMKLVCILSKLLCDKYKPDDDDNNNNINYNRKNPFDLVCIVEETLKENTNNIKTPLMIDGIIGNVAKSKSLPMNDERKNDWSVSDDSIDNLSNYTSKVPDFIQLFAINCIIGKYISTGAAVYILTSDFDNKTNEQIKSSVFNVLSRLNNHGIKTYMNKWYNEKEQTSIIEMVFSTIILKKFGQDYNQLVTHDENGHSYHTQVFNSNDLMSCILLRIWR